MSASGKKWRLRGRFPDGELADAPYPALLRHLLWHRNLRSSRDAERFMVGPLSGSGEYDPLLLPDIDRALKRLRQAVRERETVAVFGDFDVDGVTASVILTEGLRKLGARVLPYIPDRFGEGYGLNTAALDTLAHSGARLLISADCGTSSFREIAYATGLGVEVIVLDHHSVPAKLPEALAMVNPKRADSRYPERELASVGLAYKLMSALHESLNQPWEPERYLDLVALGTIADVAPLNDENRWLVKRGLLALARTTRPGLQALMDSAAVDPRTVDTETIGYFLAPRLNAAGRLAHARMAFDLLMVEDEERANQCALELSKLNQERQRQTAEAMDLAREILSREETGAPLVFIGHERISSGIVGLIAGRLAEERYRPAVVYETGEATSRASCRSIPEFDITGALRQCSDLMVRFGGHRAAAGFTAENTKLPALREALMMQAMRDLAGIDLTPVIDIDAALPLHRVNGQMIQLLQQMAPFGEGNPEPTFLSRNLEVTDVRQMGGDGKHLRLKLRDGRVTWPAVAFGLREKIGVLCGQQLDVVYSFSADRGSQGALELRVKDVAPTE